MKRRLIFHSGALADVAQAAHWYEAQQHELGIEFVDRLDQLLDRIAKSPLHFPEIETGVRRGLLRRFPFGVYFVPETDRIEVIAVLHLHRKPGKWRSRT